MDRGHRLEGCSGTSRRTFLQDTAVGVGAVIVARRFSVAAPPGPTVSNSKSVRRWTPRNVRHVAVDCDKQTFCGHPRLGGIKAFGPGELAVLYCRAYCAYKTAEDVSASPIDGYLSRADVVLRRSLDGGQNWLREHEVAVWSNRLPEEKQAFLCQDPASRCILDMCRPEAMFFIGFTSVSLRDPKTKKLVKAAKEITDAFQLRSVDKGRTWEHVPLVLEG